MQSKETFVKALTHGYCAKHKRPHNTRDRVFKTGIARTITFKQGECLKCSIERLREMQAYYANEVTEQEELDLEDPLNWDGK